MEVRGLERRRYNEFLKRLKSLAEEDYKSFSGKITPGSCARIMGVRVPALRSIAKEIAKDRPEEFIGYVLSSLEKEKMTHEEIVVFGLVIGYAKFDFNKFCEFAAAFSEYVCNWACCDVPVSSFKLIAKYTEEYKPEAERLLKSPNPWVQRVGVVTLLDYYLESPENAEYALNMINNLSSDEYYVMMAQAWLIATAAAKQRDIAVDFLKRGTSLSSDVKKMTIRKIRDSFRISPDDKELLTKLLG